MLLPPLPWPGAGATLSLPPSEGENTETLCVGAFWIISASSHVLEGELDELAHVIKSAPAFFILYTSNGDFIQLCHVS